jgi:hypothetical protein
MRSFFFPVALILAGTVAATLGCRKATDQTKYYAEHLGIIPVTPTKDSKTGFIVGGKNPTSLIRNLTELAGRPIADLEKDMRPGALSGAGFLGEDERLLEVMEADNRYVVDTLGLTHQELALHLHIIGALAVQRPKHGKEITYHGKRFRLRGHSWDGFQISPFKDGTETNCDADVENLGNGKKLSFSLLVPHMIERYGFYEGKGTSYRVEPKAVIEVFDFVKPANPS